MNKLELIQTLCTTNNLLKSEASKLVSIFFEQMATSLENSDRVEIRGLCSFYIKDYPGYTGRNPKTGETVVIQPKKLPFFKCGKGLRERVDKWWHQNWNAYAMANIPNKLLNASFLSRLYEDVKLLFLLIKDYWQWEYLSGNSKRLRCVDHESCCLWDSASGTLFFGL